MPFLKRRWIVLRSYPTWKQVYGSGLVKLNRSEVNLGYATNIRSAGYHSGKTSPSNTTLALFEEVLPGSRVEYEYGPQGEPLWAILAGKINVCQDYVDQNLPPQPGELEVRFSDRFQRVLNALVAEHRMMHMHMQEMMGGHMGGMPGMAHPAPGRPMRGMMHSDSGHAMPGMARPDSARRPPRK